MVWNSPVTYPVPTKHFLSWLFENTPEDPDKPIYIDVQNPNRSLSHAQTKTLIRQFAAGLLAHGVKAGDGMAIMAMNDILYFPLVFAAIAIEAVPCGMPVVYTPGEVKEAASVAGITYFIAGPQFLEHAMESSTLLPGDFTSSILLFDPSDEGPSVDTRYGTFKTWKSLLGHGERPWREFSHPDEAKQITSVRHLTSGTTGRSKAVNHSHYSLISQMSLVIKIHGGGPRTKVLHYLGFAHLSGIYSIGRPLAIDCALYIFSTVPTAQELVDKISELKITDITISPDYITAIIKLLPNGSDAIKSLERCTYAGASLPIDTHKKFVHLINPNGTTGSAYGLTEIGGVAAYSTGASTDDVIPGSTGKITPNVEIRLVDDSDNEITTPNTPGELLARSPGLFQNYHANPTATSAALTPDGYFRTGDRAYIDASTQHWYIVGRKKEIFKVDYEHVSPVEIEGELTAHPDIKDACVVPVTVEGEFWPRIRAFVVRKEGSGSARLDEEGVLSWMEGKLAPHKRITGGVEFVKRIPRTPFGKLERYKVVEMAKGKGAKL
ncbi:acetyl-CoA synthetase-like protein [Saccharata proteae CBS 121410]|uniref:Acetyl-CoA synthetase-like protein n=1 Tax=Saccharata proteae CBS 121410 TaxID=1314787 RepID=A0A9P4HRX9_9PEZI|nr:acetyl-CoA synthetase-like protein [Saccharata proteae CBS 121410]